MKNRVRVFLVLASLTLALLLSACQENIRGTVWSDDNGNGFRDSGENGIEGVTVRAENNDPNDPGVGTKTNSNGFYVLDIGRLSEAEWTLVVELLDARLQFTEPNAVGDIHSDDIDSDVDLSGRAPIVESEDEHIDAGILPVGFSKPQDPPEPSPTYIVEGYVYRDEEPNSIYDEFEKDEFLYEVEVQLIDVESGQIWLKTETNLAGYYKFEITQVDKSFVVKVIPHEAGFEFPPPTDGAKDVYPSRVGPDGSSVEEISFQEQGHVVNAALYQPKLGEIFVETGEVFRVSCETGEDTENDPFPGTTFPFPGTTFEPTGDETGFEWFIDLPNLPAETTFCWGFDVTGEDKPIMGPHPNLALVEGNHYSVSACAVNGALAGINAAQTDLNGESVQISTAATASIGGGVASLVVPESDLPSGMTGVRLVVSDLVTCYLSGPLEVNNGYRPPEEFGPGVALALAAADGTRSCDSANNTCLMISDNLTWERTGDQTVAITLDGVFYAVQFNVLAGTVETRQADFTSLGWVLDLDDSTMLETPLRTWQIIPLQANGFPYGYLAVSDNGSSEKPFVFAVSILGADPQSETALEALAGVINDLAADFRSAFELLE